MKVDNNLDFSGHISNVRKKITCDSQREKGREEEIDEMILSMNCNIWKD